MRTFAVIVLLSLTAGSARALCPPEAAGGATFSHIFSFNAQEQIDSASIQVPGSDVTCQLNIDRNASSQLLPWEVECFEVDQNPDGTFLLKMLAAAYEYQVSQNGCQFTLTPGQKIPTPPDPAGITAAPVPLNTENGLSIDFSDRWWTYYNQTDEQTMIHVELHDATVNSKMTVQTPSFAPAASYHIDFSQYKPPMQHGHNYYVVWGFERKGNISAPLQYNAGQTGEITYTGSTFIPSQ